MKGESDVGSSNAARMMRHLCVRVFVWKAGKWLWVVAQNEMCMLSVNCVLAPCECRVNSLTAVADIFRLAGTH